MKGAEARRERAREEMRQAVLSSAAKTVAAGGIESLTIRGIARDLGYSPGAIYEYFPSKDDIVASLYFKGSGGLSEAMSTCCLALGEDEDVLTTLTALGKVFRETALANPELYRLAFGVMKQPDRVELMGSDDAPGAFGVLMRVVQRGIDSGDLKPGSPLEIAVGAWALAHGFISLEVSNHLALLPMGDDMLEISEEQRSELYMQALRTFVRGWATEQGLASFES